MNIDLEALKQGLSVANSAVRVSAIAEETERNQRILDQTNKQPKEMLLLLREQRQISHKKNSLSSR